MPLAALFGKLHEHKLELDRLEKNEGREQKVSDYELNEKPTYEKLEKLFHDLHGECLTLSKTCAKQKKLISSLERKANDTNVELEKVKTSTCNKCQEPESKIVELNQVIKNYEKGQIGLEDLLSRQRYSNNKIGFGFSNLYKPSTNKTIFIKASTTSDNIETKKMHSVNPPRRFNLRTNSNGRNYSNSYHVHKSTCFYCNTKGHTPNTCYIRNYGVPYGEYVWIKKGTNPRGPKEKMGI